MNSDVAAYQQLTFNDGDIERDRMLAVIDMIPIPMDITIYVNGPHPDGYDVCLKDILMKELKEKTLKYRRKLQVFNSKFKSNLL